MKRIISMILAVIMLACTVVSLGSCSTDVPYVGENGNWWIGETDTGVLAKGKTGDKGETGDAGANGKGGIDGKDGLNGIDGKNGIDNNGANYPKYRYNALTNKYEVTLDNGKTWTNVGSAEAGKNDVLSYPVSSIEKLPGTIADANNKYIVTSQENGGWHGGIVDLEKLDYDFVTLVRNANGNELGYSFLKSMPTVGQVPNFATGYTNCVWNYSESVTLRIPDDARYMYIYYNSEGAIHLPSSVTFSR